MADRNDRTITIQVLGPEAEGADLRLDDFLEQMESVRTAFRETERLVWHRDPSLYLRIKKLQKSSPAIVMLEAVSDEVDERAEAHYASYVVRSLTTNLRIISKKKRLPARIDMPTLESYRELAVPLERHKLEIQIRAGNNSVVLNRGFRELLEQVIGRDEFSYGSISGTIEELNVHGENRFRLYPIVGPSRVIGHFRSRDRKRFTGAMDKYVTVYGRLRYKTWEKYPHEILADDINIHDTEVPTLKDLKGVSPGATGDLTTQEYLDDLRDEQ